MWKSCSERSIYLLYRCSEPNKLKMCWSISSILFNYRLNIRFSAFILPISNVYSNQILLKQQILIDLGTYLIITITMSKSTRCEYGQYIYRIHGPLFRAVGYICVCVCDRIACVSSSVDVHFTYCTDLTFDVIKSYEMPAINKQNRERPAKLLNLMQWLPTLC